MATYLTTKSSPQSIGFSLSCLSRGFRDRLRGLGYLVRVGLHTTLDPNSNSARIADLSMRSYFDKTCAGG